MFKKTSSSFNYSIALLTLPSNTRNHAMEAENKKCHINQRGLFIIDHQRGIGRFFMWKLSKDSQTEGVVT